MERRRRLLTSGGTALALGLSYAVWVRLTGLAIPCPFRTVTGWLCPGCGVTRLCLALLRRDWRSAWNANPVLLLMLPVLAVLGAHLAVRYVREGSTAGPKWESALMWAMAALLAVWGVVRNFL